MSSIFKNRSESSSGKKHVRLLIWPLLLLVFSIYTNSLRAPYYLDDEFNIVKNPHIRLTQITLDGLIKAGIEGRHPNRPVANLSFGLNYYFGGCRYSAFIW